MTFFFGKHQLSPEVLDLQSAIQSILGDAAVPSRTGICISRGLQWREGKAEVLLGVSEMANKDTLQGPASGCPFAIWKVSQHWQ